MIKSIWRILLMCVVVIVLFGVWMTSEIRAQDTLNPRITFAPYAQNPVIQRGVVADDDADCGTIFAPKALVHNDAYYLFYTGSCKRSGHPSTIDFAISEDGFNWVKSSQNPLLVPDGEGYDAMCVSIGVPIVVDNQWILYYAGNSQPCAGPGRYIARAVAPAPTGPWVRSTDPLLSAGAPGAWDEGFIMPHAVIQTEAGYTMFFSGGSEYLLPLPRLIGVAFSPDGVTWTKYNDPTTIDQPYAQSDPILELADDGTSVPFSAWAVDVIKTQQRWEMFFSGTCPESEKQDCPGYIAYASSVDGIRWRTYRTPEQVVLTPDKSDQLWASHCVCFPSAIKQDGHYLLYYTGCANQSNDCQIGLATGTIEWK